MIGDCFSVPCWRSSHLKCVSVTSLLPSVHSVVTSLKSGDGVAQERVAIDVYVWRYIQGHRCRFFLHTCCVLLLWNFIIYIERLRTEATLVRLVCKKSSESIFSRSWCTGFPADHPQCISPSLVSLCGCHRCNLLLLFAVVMLLLCCR